MDRVVMSNGTQGSQGISHIRVSPCCVGTVASPSGIANSKHVEVVAPIELGKSRGIQRNLIAYRKYDWSN
jgi:hypothetical protein